MSKLPYFPFFNQDWLSSPKVRLMTDAQEGIYIHLLASAWDFSGTYLRANRKTLQRLCPRSKWKNIKFVLHNCFLIDDGGYLNPRLTEISRVSDERVESATRAAKCRWNKESQDAGAMPTRTLSRTISKEVKVKVSQADARDRALSLNAFLEKAKVNGSAFNEEACEVIQLFLERYEHFRHELHPKLKYSQWLHHVKTILYVDDNNNDSRSIDMSYENHEAMITKYFNTHSYNGGRCDYRINHYNTPGVKEILVYEVVLREG